MQPHTQGLFSACPITIGNILSHLKSTFYIYMYILIQMPDDIELSVSFPSLPGKFTLPWRISVVFAKARQIKLMVKYDLLKAHCYSSTLGLIIRNPNFMEQMVWSHPWHTSNSVSCHSKQSSPFQHIVFYLTDYHFFYNSVSWVLN